jgi:hypothetical protein
MAEADIAARGPDVVKRDRSATGGARGLLWLNRALNFITTFMELLARPDKAQVRSRG